MPETTYHVGVDVRGALANWTAREAKGCKDSAGRQMTIAQVRIALAEQLAQGHEIIPVGQPCDNWDWKKGCQGHRAEETAHA